MYLIKNEDKQFLSRYELFDDYEDFMLHVEKLDNNICVQVIGLYNSGKSSLLNALTNSYDDENFAVADVVQTKEVKSLDYKDIVFIDTPGLNVDLKDDKNAFFGFSKSDVYLFVHSVSTGELSKTEVDYMQTMLEKNNLFLDGLIIVLSRKDQANENDIKNVKNIIKKQISDVFKDKASSVKIIEVSSESYKKGKKENKNILVNSSNIDTLIDIIENKKIFFKENIKTTRMQQIKNHSLLKKINDLIKEKKSQLEKTENEYYSLEKTINDEIQKANSNLKKLH